MRAILKRLPLHAVKNPSTQSVTGMGEVIHVSFGEVQYSASVQGVLSKRIQGKLDQLENAMQSGAQHGMRPMDTAIQALLEKGEIAGKDAYKKAINKAKFEHLKDVG